eukprot:CAMPEP_0174256988 /NCGR_PEP_ID=MMETSP0439-20130205/6173_1 /TAXON_ID=0 /ORGANISM="Stereomyxa ramosa, Strain Chinc5" /LENGTH=327 /DNA_ID=CAMNT_0015339865 /DNA_START=51 /DNA_END=1034 /DNA_ORIENTATION=-
MQEADLDDVLIDVSGDKLSDDEIKDMEDDLVRMGLIVDEDGESNPTKYGPPNMRSYGNTGPKGVLADYAEAKVKGRLRREAEALAFQLKMQDKAVSYNDKPSLQKQDKNTSSDEDWEDDDFMEEYKAKRLAELKAKGQIVVPAVVAPRTFGVMKKIARFDFPTEIDAELDSGCFVVIHLYKDTFPACVKLNYCLKRIAARYPTVKFLKIISTEASATYKDKALPTLLIYQNGELVKSFIKVVDDLGSHDFDEDDVLNLLSKHGIITKKMIDQEKLDDTKSIIYDNKFGLADKTEEETEQPSTWGSYWNSARDWLVQRNVLSYQEPSN